MRPRAYFDVYIAAPYSCHDPEVRSARARIAARYASKLTKEGLIVFAPTVQGHAMATYGPLDYAWPHWEAWAMEWQERAKAMHVLMLEGWTMSKGLQKEISKATQLRQPIIYIKEEDIG